MTKKSYLFISHWHIVGSSAHIIEAIKSVSDWPVWWNGLESVHVDKDAQKVIGNQAAMLWRAPIGYRLKLHLTITNCIPSKLIAFTSEGDLQGSGTWKLKRKGEATNIVIVWEVETTKRWMNMLAFLLHPLFDKSHDQLMQRGEQGLQRYITNLPRLAALE